MLDTRSEDLIDRSVTQEPTLLLINAGQTLGGSFYLFGPPLAQANEDGRSWLAWMRKERTAILVAEP